ncbi:pentapeptide repeat-containing protein [Neolewinella antarctica]
MAFHDCDLSRANFANCVFFKSEFSMSIAFEASFDNWKF